MTSPLRAQPGTLSEDVPSTGERILVGKSGRILALNPMAAAVWDLLDGTRDVLELASILNQAVGVDPEQARRDVQDLVKRLMEEGFLEGAIETDAAQTDERP